MKKYGSQYYLHKKAIIGEMNSAFVIPNYMYGQSYKQKNIGRSPEWVRPMQKCAYKEYSNCC